MTLPVPVQRTREFYQQLPKVDLHRHLEGSIRFETIRQLAREHGMDLPPTSELRGMVQVSEQENLTFENFLSKFTTLRLFYRTPEIIGRITREAIADAAADNVRYLELRFTPVALSRSQGFSLAEVMDWVIEGARQASQQYGVMTRLIASVNRHENATLAAQVSYLAAERLSQGIVGLDLAGDEANFNAVPFQSIFINARAKGLRISVHAGEWNGAASVVEAINILGAERIGHGVRVLDTSEAINLARARGIPFEVCLTSNYQSGVVPALAAHPMPRMLAEGLNVTLNTDDPSISQITLSDEYALACDVLGLSLNDLRQRVIAAAEASFLPPIERRRLVQRLQKEFPLA
jgi:adenosine deaminase